MSKPPIQISPSVLASDFSRLGDEVEAVVEAGADRIHWDVMDGVFVPNLTIGPDVIAACRNRTDAFFEAHLMVVNPDQLAHRYVEAGCDLVMVHAEACDHLHRSLDNIREHGAEAGVVLNPHTPAEAVAHVLDLVDMVLVMTVNPGFGGQKYLPTMEPKIAKLRQMIELGGYDVDLEVDGGIGPSTIGGAVAAGANVFVAGNAVFRHPDGLAPAIPGLREAAAAAGA